MQVEVIALDENTVRAYRHQSDVGVGDFILRVIPSDLGMIYREYVSPSMHHGDLMHRYLASNYDNTCLENYEEFMGSVLCIIVQKAMEKIRMARPDIKKIILLAREDRVPRLLGRQTIKQDEIAVAFQQIAECYNPALPNRGSTPCCRKFNCITKTPESPLYFAETAGKNDASWTWYERPLKCRKYMISSLHDGSGFLFPSSCIVDRRMEFKAGSLPPFTVLEVYMDDGLTSIVATDIMKIQGRFVYKNDTRSRLSILNMVLQGHPDIKIAGYRRDADSLIKSGPPTNGGSIMFSRLDDPFTKQAKVYAWKSYKILQRYHAYLQIRGNSAYSTAEGCIALKSGDLDRNPDVDCSGPIFPSFLCKWDPDRRLWHIVRKPKHSELRVFDYSFVEEIKAGRNPLITPSDFSMVCVALKKNI